MRVAPGRAALALAYMLMMLSLSSLPARDVARLGFQAQILNLMHIPLFAGLAWLAVSAFIGPAPKRVALTAGLCLAFAVTDEWYQSFIPGRVPALQDVMADAGGIALGLACREGVRPVLLAWKGEMRQ
jgi:VanZ family protein